MDLKFQPGLGTEAVEVCQSQERFVRMHCQCCDLQAFPWKDGVRLCSLTQTPLTKLPTGRVHVRAVWMGMTRCAINTASTCTQRGVLY